MSNDRTTSLTELLNNDNMDSQIQQSRQPQQAEMQAQMQAQQIQAQQIQAQQMQAQQMKALQENVTDQHVKEVKNKSIMDNIKNIDFKSALFVFAIILILTSGAFSSFSRSSFNGLVGPDNRITMLGSFVTAIIGMIMFIIIKMISGS